MPKRVAIDTGPCVALFDRDDAVHERAVEFIKESRAELVTTLASLTEAMHLLDFSPSAARDLLTWVCQGAVTLLDPEPGDYSRVMDLMDKYADLPMDFADGLLVALCERLGIKNVASIDRDFSIYRFKSHGRLENVFPS